jgi:signal transduction histidine kinase/ActR/RegA family two-component response regulator
VQGRLTDRALRYGLALTLAGAITLIAPALARLSPGAHLLFSTGAVVLTAWFGGFGPGALATLLIAFVCFLALRDPPATPLANDVWLISFFALEGLLISAAGGMRRRAERQLREDARQRAAIAELSRWTLAQENLAKLLEDAAHLVLETLNMDRVEIAQFGSRTIHVDRRDPRIGAPGASVAPQGLATRPHFAGSEQQDRRATIVLDTAGRRMESLATVPIMGESEVFGNLDVFAGRRRRLAAADLDFVHAIANVLAVGIRRRLADQEAERLRERDALLADVTAKLSLSLDYATRVTALAETLVPRLADWCIVDVLEETGKLQRFAIEHRDPEQADVARGLQSFPPSDASPDDPVMIALRTGASQLVSRVAEADLRRIASGEEHFELLRRVGLRSIMSVPLRARGRTLGVVTFGGVSRQAYDVTDLTLAEEVAQRAALALDNARLYERLLADDRAKDEFLAMLGHELRNPLAPMVHSLEVFRVASPDSEARERARRVLERQVAQLRHLVRDLLDVARVTRGTIELRREPVELSDAIANAIESSQPLIQSHRHVLVTQLPPDPVWIDADPVRLEQILTNLVNNAVEHSRPQARTDLSVERQGDQAILRVKDTGAGLSPAMITRVFDLFTPGDIMESGPGTGIGLHLVRRLVQLHGGSIEARSPGVGRGSEFIVCFPTISGAPARAESAPSPAASEPANHLRVLVVDDHMDTAAALSELIGLWGYEVRTALDGREALRVAESFRPELVLLDLAMPDMNGYQVAAEMRKMPGLTGATIVALTGHAREQARERAAGFQFDHHWIKPLDANSLKAFIEERAKHRHGAFAS